METRIPRTFPESACLITTRRGWSSTLATRAQGSRLTGTLHLMALATPARRRSSKPTVSTFMDMSAGPVCALVLRARTQISPWTSIQLYATTTRPSLTPLMCHTQTGPTITTSMAQRTLCAASERSRPASHLTHLSAWPTRTSTFLISFTRLRSTLTSKRSLQPILSAP